MSKSKKKKPERENQSMVDECKAIFSQLEKQGYNLDEALNKFGGKDLLIQYLQDLEDDVVNDSSEVFKEAYAEGDIRRCVRSIVNIVKDDWFVNKQGLRRALYTDGNLLKNPLNYSFNKEDFEKTTTIIWNSVNYLNKSSATDGSCISEEMAKNSSEELIQLALMYECMYHNRIQTDKALNDSNFLKLSLPQIIHSFLVFFQSQTNLSREKIAAEWKQHEMVTGLEALVSSEVTSLNPNAHVSMIDSLEQLLEDIDILFRFIYRLKADEIEKSERELKELDYVTPYESIDYSKLDYYVLIDVWHTKMEASFRYSNWNIQLLKDQDDVEVYGFYPSDEKAYKTHIASGLRKKHNVFLQTASEKANEILQNHSHYNQLNLDKNVSFKLPGDFFTEYLSVSNRLNLNDIESFHFDKDEYKRLSYLIEPLIESTKRRNKSYYFTCVLKDNIKVLDYLNAYVFLYTISKVYFCAAIKSEKQNELVKLVNLQYLYTEFAILYDYKQDLSKKLIDSFVFDKTIARKKIYGDIFTRPLINVGSNMVLLSEALIDQANLDRNIEVLLEWNNVNLAPVGKELENNLIKELENVGYLNVNTNKLEFMAYDHRNVEFDFFATIEDYLILIEMKSLLQPYDDDELYRRRKTISDGVEQLLRRVKIVQNDWDKIREKASIVLPVQPYDEDHIIKVVCTDVCDYTGLESKGVILSDYATVIKYFTNPFVHAVIDKPGKGFRYSKKQVLWKDDRPTAKEFIEYLGNPDTMNYLLECLKPEWKSIPLLDNYKKIACFDMLLKEDPWKKLADLHDVLE